MGDQPCYRAALGAQRRRRFRRAGMKRSDVAYDRRSGWRKSVPASGLRPNLRPQRTRQYIDRGGAAIEHAELDAEELATQNRNRGGNDGIVPALKVLVGHTVEIKRATRASGAREIGTACGFGLLSGTTSHEEHEYEPAVHETSKSASRTARKHRQDPEILQARVVETPSRSGTNSRGSVLFACLFSSR